MIRALAILAYGLLALSDLYGALSCALLSIRNLVRNRWIVLEVFNGLFPLAVAPAIFFLPLNLWLGRPLQTLLLLPAAGKFLRDYGLRYLPRVTPYAAYKGTLSILTHNLEHENMNIEAIAEIICQADADLVLLQELNPRVARALQARFAQAYPYCALHPSQDYAGQGVLSRYPILHDEYWTRQMGNQRVDIQVDGRRLTVYNVHPAAPMWNFRLNYRPRLREIAELVRLSRENDGPVILAGDFNMSDQSREYARVTKHYRDSFDEVGYGLGLTIHNHVMILRLDYVFHSPHFQALEAFVWPTSGGSDHRPLRVTLALPPE